MSNPYATQTKSASATLLRKGQRMTLFRMVIAEYDPMFPANTLPTIDQQCDVSGVVIPASAYTISAFDKTILDDPVRRRDFRLVLLAGLTLAGIALPFQPQALDILSTAEGYYRLIGATGLDPAGAGSILWNCGCTLDVQVNLGEPLPTPTPPHVTFVDTDDVDWELADP